MKVFVKNKPVELTKTHYKGSGGEGSVYCKGRTGYKIYHDPKKMIPTGKIQELGVISLPNVLAPMEVIYDTRQHPIGFTMPYVDKIEFLCKLFVKGFRDRENVSPKMIVDIITEMQKTLIEIHKKNILVVDYN